MQTRLTGTGIWSGGLRYGDAAAVADAAAELETLGYSALWIPDIGGELFGPLANLLGATTTATIATGILNVWMHTADTTAAEHARLTSEHGDRFLCGVGISHGPLIDNVIAPGTYQQPLAVMTAYLDGLDAAPTPLAQENRVIAALGPQSRQRQSRSNMPRCRRVRTSTDGRQDRQSLVLNARSRVHVSCPIARISSA